MSIYLRQINALYVTDYDRRTKRCEFCDILFCDVTKRNLRKTCTKQCRFDLMVAKRKKVGNYKQTEEQRRKKSESCKATFSSRDCFSPKLRKKFSETMKRNWRENRIDTTNHWTKSDEGKSRLRKLNKGRVHSDVSRRNMSLGQRRRIRTKRESLYTSAKGGFRSDINCYVRSMWEANFARIQQYKGLTWEYEPQTFELTPTMSYTPDFKVGDIFYEIKGRWRDVDRLKIDLFNKKFSKYTLRIIDPQAYEALRIKFKDLIGEAWEGR